MRDDQWCFLTVLGQVPARLAVEPTEWVLNCQPHDVPILVAARLLKPLGNPPPNSVKYFAACEVLEQTQDRAWLGKVTNTLNQHWQKKNSANRQSVSKGELSAPAAFVGPGPGNGNGETP